MTLTNTKEDPNLNKSKDPQPKKSKRKTAKSSKKKNRQKSRRKKRGKQKKTSKITRSKSRNKQSNSENETPSVPKDETGNSKPREDRINLSDVKIDVMPALIDEISLLEEWTLTELSFVNDMLTHEVHERHKNAPPPKLTLQEEVICKDPETERTTKLRTFRARSRQLVKNFFARLKSLMTPDPRQKFPRICINEEDDMDLKKAVFEEGEKLNGFVNQIGKKYQNYYEMYSNEMESVIERLILLPRITAQEVSGCSLVKGDRELTFENYMSGYIESQKEVLQIVQKRLLEVLRQSWLRNQMILDRLHEEAAKTERLEETVQGLDFDLEMTEVERWALQ